MTTLSSQHRRFLVVDQIIGPIFVNFLLNAAIAWLTVRSLATVPLWGQTSIAADTLATAFILPVLTSLIVSRVVAHQVTRGRLAPIAGAHASSSPWTARSSLHRGAAIGSAAVVLAAVPVVAFFVVAGPAELEPGPFIWFKAAFAAALGVLVTPLLGWWALGHASRRAEPALAVPSS